MRIPKMPFKRNVMTANDISLPVIRQEGLVSNRALGTIGMLGSPMLLLEGLLFGFYTTIAWMGLGYAVRAD